MPPALPPGAQQWDDIMLVRGILRRCEATLLCLDAQASGLSRSVAAGLASLSGMGQASAQARAMVGYMCCGACKDACAMGVHSLADGLIIICVTAWDHLCECGRKTVSVNVWEVMCRDADMQGFFM